MIQGDRTATCRSQHTSHTMICFVTHRENTNESGKRAWFLTSTASRCFLSASANCSACCTMRCTSSSFSVLAPVILMSCCRPVPEYGPDPDQLIVACGKAKPHLMEAPYLAPYDCKAS